MVVDPLVVLGATSAVVLVGALVFVVLWLVARTRARRERALRFGAEREIFAARLSADEHLARLRIIRELTEVTIDSVTSIIGQADGAGYAGERDAAAAVRAVVAIGEAARNTLADLRRVSTITSEAGSESASGADFGAGPLPRLQSVEDLLHIMREAGLVIEFEESGARFELGRGAELAVYRILQESLSNALAHGGTGTQARVSLTWNAEGLHVRVDDDGVRAILRREGRDPNVVTRQRSYSIDEDLGALTEVVTGAGITEMRERAALFGGVFNAYSVPGVGFSISAVFPTLKYHNGIHGVNLGA